MSNDKSLSLAYALAFFFGGLGAHLFYIGKKKRGIFYLLFCWTYIPILLGWLDMLSIRKWMNHQSHLPAKKAVETDVEDISETTYISSSKKFYNESTIILPKYAHLLTPPNITNDIEEIANPRKSSIDTNYGKISFSVTMSTSGTEFIKDSLKFSHVEGKPSSFEPLMVYWTTFDKLNKRQKNWYFYWRQQVIKGNYLDTDLSYIILFIYELINYSFNQNAAFNASMMARLHENYIERVPKLGNYLPVWLADFLYELGYEDLAKEWDTRKYDGEYGIYTHLKQKECELHKISFTFWKPYIRNYKETQFFQNNKNKIYKIFKESIPILKEAYEIQNKQLLDEWFNLVEGKQSRYLFGSAVIGRKTSREYFFETMDYRPTEQMFDDITNLFRLSENVTRLLHGEKRQIKVIEEKLPEGIKEEMLYHFSSKKSEDVKRRFKKVQGKQSEGMGSKIPQPEESQVETKLATNSISLDFERIKQIKIESDELQTAFEEQFGNDESVLTQSKKIKEDKIVESLRNEKVAATSEPALDFFSTNGDIDETSFIDSLSDLEKQFLLGFQDGRILVTEAQQFIKSKGAMPGTFIDTLNEKAMEYLEENLIEQDGEEYEIYEEFICILEKVKEVA